MIHITHGDLLESDCTIIGHQANCFSTMKSGIAKQIVKRYPIVAEADLQYPLPPKARLGKHSFVRVSDQRFVMNLYGQYFYGHGQVHTEYQALSSSLGYMMEDVLRLKQTGFPVKIGLPYKIGCGLAGGDWDRVLDILISTSEHFHEDLYLYKLD